LRLDSSGNPVVVWKETDGDIQDSLFVKRWNGTAWTQVGGAVDILVGHTNPEYPTLGIDSSGNPVVGWSENDGISKNIYLKRFSGSDWLPLGSGFLDVNLNQAAIYASLVLDSSDKITVAWTETDGTSSNVYVKRQP
jgi:hypothetical protein